MATEIRCVWDEKAALGEGTHWSPGQQALYWVDIIGKRLFRYTPESRSKESWSMPEMIGWVVERDSGGLVAGLKNGIGFLDPTSLVPVMQLDPEPNLPDNRLNDAKVDPAGRLWFGTMDDAQLRSSGSLYRLDGDMSVSCWDSDYGVTNGPAFSPDGKTLYHTQSNARTVYAFDLAADGAISNKRVFVTFNEADGYPDGMTTDADGGLWIGHWEGWKISRFHPDGRHDRSIEMPVARCSNVTFGGPDLDIIYVSTASVGMADSEWKGQPQAGGLFEVRAGVKGMTPHYFRG
ncbi:MAG: SMP-30/gluconolactonase/LRE family protein [Rhodospirillales bacterium]|nr:SMP-30/gluconolactonase/LRE family protein [Rhodospirillales bacterium]